MESEYMSNYKQILSTDTIRESFRDKRDYRRRRRLRELEHQPLGDVEMEEAKEQRKTSSPTSSPRASGPPFIPTLDLRPTPSPAPSPTPSSGVGSGESVESVMEKDQRRRSPSPSPPIRVQSRAIQTALPYEQIEHRKKAIIKNHYKDYCGKVQATRTIRGRSQSPFAMYGNGNRAARTSEKRTFNIKATNGVQVHETAIRAALRQGFPLPQRSRKAELLNPKKTSHHSHHPTHQKHSL